MGGAPSRPDGSGYRVLRVEPNSPGSLAEASWVPYLDVLSHAGGVDLAEDPSAFASQLKRHIGVPLELTVVNAKSRRVRTVTVVPSADWGGEGLLGLQVRYDAPDAPTAPDSSEEDEWALHVVDVSDDADAPAARAGLTPLDDFILGAHDVSFADTDALADYVYERAGSEVVLYVYRASSDSVRTLPIFIPEGGTLGASVANGRMHTLPHTDTEGVGEDGGCVGVGSGMGGMAARTMNEFLGAGASVAAQKQPQQAQQAGWDTAVWEGGVGGAGALPQPPVGAQGYLAPPSMGAGSGVGAAGAAAAAAPPAALFQAAARMPHQLQRGASAAGGSGAPASPFAASPYAPPAAVAAGAPLGGWAQPL